MELKLNLNESNSSENSKENTDKDENGLNKNMFEFNYIIGKGGFGKVWKVKYKKTNEFFALKEMSKRKIIDKKSEKSINSERKFLSLLNHPFIVNMHYAFQDKDNLYLVMDMLSGGDLRYHCSRYRVFSEEQTRFFIACIIYSLEYIHSNNVIHRDIKPENLVLDDKGYVRITDFGIAKENMLDNSSETSGTPGYMSPEVMNGENHSFPVDYFAVGIIGYEFLMGKRPYNGKNRNEIKEKMLKENVIISDDKIKKGWSIEAAEFINQLLEKNKDKRLGAIEGVKELKEHEWLKYYPWEELEDKKLPAPFIPEKIDNFDKEYCESIENISEETKFRYEKIFSSPNYKLAFVDFYYNKEIPKYQRRQTKTHRLIANNNKTNNDKNNENNNSKIERSNISEDEKENNNSFDKEKEKLNNKNKNNENNINQQINVNNFENKNNNGKNSNKIIENDKNENNIIKLNIQNKVSNENKKINHQNSNSLNKKNNFKKIVINNNHMKKSNGNNYIKEYIKCYLNINHEKSKQKNDYSLYMKNKEKNNHLHKKHSSQLDFSSRIINYNNKIDFFLNSNYFSKKIIENNNKSPLKYYLLNNKSNNSHLILKKNENKIKYEKIKSYKKKNNSFRINYIKNNNEDKKNRIKRFYNIPSYNNLNKKNNNIINNTNNMDRKFLNNIGINIVKQKIYNQKFPIYINNNSFINNSNNPKSNRAYSFYSKRLYNTNNNANSPNIKYNSINIASKKDKIINFKRKLEKFKLRGSTKNIINNKNIKDANDIQTNIKIKNIFRANSANDCQIIYNKLNREDKIKNNNINRKSNKQINLSSNNKNILLSYKPI